MKVMGIDLGISKVAWSIWEEDVLVGTHAFISTHSHRPWQLRECARHISLMNQRLMPDHIWIEDTLIGNNKKYSIKLSQTMGAVLSEIYRSHDKIFTVNVSTWKKEVIGSGHASKEDIQSYLYSRDSAYAVLCGNDQDRFDAACIGYYGVLIANRAGAMADSG